MKFLTRIERKIITSYHDKGIKCISDLSIERISELYQIDVINHNRNSDCFNDKDYALIYLDNRKPFNEQRFDFFHEFGHVFMHCGDQREIPKPFRRLQESQAYYFSLYASMPRYIFEPLMKSLTVYELIQLFDLPENAIRERVHIIKRQERLKIYYQQLKKKEESRIRKSYDPTRWSNETWRILNQLKTQTGKEVIDYESFL